MRKTTASAVVVASVLLGAASAALAGAYGEAPEPEEMPQPVAVAPAPEPEPEAPRIMRKFAGFLSDAETARGLWGEVGVGYEAETDSGPDLDLWRAFARLAYGGEMWEAGLQLPYTWVDGPGVESNGLEDMQFWAKVIPVRTEIFQGGTGLIVTAPTGDGAYSLDEWGFEPFLTGAVAAGPASIRGTVGYTRFLDLDDSDGITYNAAVLVPANDRVVLRGEFDGAHYVDLNADENPVSFVPGLDIRFPMGTSEMWLRLSGAVGITDEASDWGFGVSLAYVQL